MGVDMMTAADPGESKEGFCVGHGCGQADILGSGCWALWLRGKWAHGAGSMHAVPVGSGRGFCCYVNNVLGQTGVEGKIF